MNNVILEALVDSLKLLPFLLVIYLGIEWVEYRFGSVIRHRISHAHRFGPILGALFGCVPQCGFSVVGSALYIRRLITTGSLLAIFLSTSDEAVPIILAQPARVSLIGPLIFTKVLIAILGGYLVDLLTFRRAGVIAHEHSAQELLVAVGGGATESPLPTVACHSHTAEDAHEEEPAEEEEDVTGCCEHHVAGKMPWREVLVHPLRHTFIVFLFIFAVSAVVNLLFFSIGQQRLAAMMLTHSVFQPIITAFVGLIPNCAASVAITELYLRGVIDFGSLISGLCASSGMGLLLLMKENPTRDTLRVIALLLLISITAGELLALRAG